jgi:dihydroflavonol-4-reductase
MRIFITGATGFVGGHLVSRLAQTEHEVCCLVRRTSHVRQLEELGATLISGDVTDKGSLLDAMQDIDWVVNLAANSSLWVRDKQVYTDINIRGVQDIMESALERGVSKVLHVSSAAVYGRPRDCPFTEESPAGPVRASEYARTKYAGDLITWALHDTNGLPLVMVYPGRIVGPGDNSPGADQIRYLSQGRVPFTVFSNAVLTYVHVGDVAEVIVRALEKTNNNGEKYLVGRERLSGREFAALVCEVAAVRAPRIRLPDPVTLALFAPDILLSNIMRRPPMLGLSTDTIRQTKQGFSFDGSKAERELGITYTPIRVAVEEAIASQ